MDASDVTALKSAINSLTAGNPQPFVDLMDDDMVWGGAARGWLWWRTAPA